MKIICTVTTDLSYDQRMARICSSLSSFGYEVELVGREKQDSATLKNKPYKQTRIKCHFEKGKLFYLEYNLRLIIYLLKAKADVVCSCDLDTILAGVFKKSLHRTKLVYDAHEYFTEMEEVVQRPLVKRIWKILERFSIPRTDLRYTVSHGYAQLFENEYKMQFGVVRNVTMLNSKVEEKIEGQYILYQGAVNHGRGLKELIRSMPMIDSKLIICGKGDVYDDLIKLTRSLGLEEKVSFTGYLEPAQLRKYTHSAYIGITLFTDDGLSNRYSLANRFFDYMHAGVPQLAMNYPEYKDFNNEFEVASLIDTVDVRSITSALNHLLKNTDHYERLRQNATEARKVHNWQSDEEKLRLLYESL